MESFKETFACELDERGIYQLGYRAEFNLGTILVRTGATEVAESSVTVSKADDAYDYLNAMEKARKATVWNDVQSEVSDLLDYDQAQEAIRAAVAWSAESHPHRAADHTRFSHHGIYMAGAVVSHGTVVPIHFSHQGAARRSGDILFMAYEKDGYLDGLRKSWIKSDYDPKAVTLMIVDAVGSNPIDSWNVDRSVTFKTGMSKSTAMLFDNYEKDGCRHCTDTGVDLPFPEGWR